MAMRAQTFRRHWTWAIASAAAALASMSGGVLAESPDAAAADQAGFPEYRIDPCCSLCPAAQNPASYNTGFLESFRTLLAGDDGWLFRSEDDLKLEFGPDEHGLRQLARLRAALAARGVTLVMMLQPPRGLMHRAQLHADDRAHYNAELAQFSYVRTLQRLREAGIIVPDLEQLVYRPGEDYFFRADHHWTPDGARRTAEIVAERIRELPAYAQVDQRAFATRADGLFRKRGTFHKAVQRMCGFGASPQYVRSYITEPAEESDGAALLGESAPPSITLVGTSNSDPAYNFAGFLSEYLSADVLNASIAGGGMDSSMLVYLGSREFREQPPRILIWELQPYHNLSDAEFYRQVIPTLDGGCDGRAATLSDERALRAGRNEVLFNGGGRVMDLAGGDYLLDVRFSDPDVRELEAVVWYTNGRRDTVSLQVPPGSNDGRFVFGLRDDGEWADWTFLSLDIHPVGGPAPGERIETRLCRRGPAADPIVTAQGELS
jgi:alginate biosynthesis protein AlgX